MKTEGSRELPLESCCPRLEHWLTNDAASQQQCRMEFSGPAHKDRNIAGNIELAQHT